MRFGELQYLVRKGRTQTLREKRIVLPTRIPRLPEHNSSGVQIRRQAYMMPPSLYRRRGNKYLICWFEERRMIRTGEMRPLSPSAAPNHGFHVNLRNYFL